MGPAATVVLPVALVTGDAVTKAQNFISVFATVYTLVIFAYIITSWLRLPYSVWLNRIQRFLYDVTEPYLRIFRRILPATGPLDFSPMLAVIVLWAAAYALNRILGHLH
jgi:YggT family protein